MPRESRMVKRKLELFSTVTVYFYFKSSCKYGRLKDVSLLCYTYDYIPKNHSLDDPSAFDAF
jgi:hypothetical protein